MDIYLPMTNKATEEHQEEVREDGLQATDDLAAGDTINQDAQSTRMQLRKRNTLRPLDRYTANYASYNIPQSFSEAVSGSDAESWRKAIDKELEAYQRNGTWKLIPRDANMRTIDSKWVFKVNTNQGTPIFKARLCVRGFLQKEEIDYTETFSPVVRYDSLRVLLSHITRKTLR